VLRYHEGYEDRPKVTKTVAATKNGKDTRMAPFHGFIVGFVVPFVFFVVSA
jgi:hypothetical protein